MFSALAGDMFVADYYTKPTLYFRFPTQETAQELDIRSAVLYGATYEFYDANLSGLYKDLQAKLTSLYGEPFSEDGDLDTVFGPILIQSGDERVEISIAQAYQEGLDSYRPLSYTAWKSGTNGAMILLIHYFVDGEWEVANLHYFDLSADAAVLAMYGEGEGNVDGL